MEFFMLKSPKPIIYPAHKCQNANNSWHSNTNALEQTSCSIESSIKKKKKKKKGATASGTW